MGASNFDMHVDGLHGVGRTTSSRSSGAQSSSKGLKEGLDGATMGHPTVVGALSTFVTGDIVDHANKLPVQVDNAGVNVSNVASTSRDYDNEAGAGLKQPVARSAGDFAHINRQL